MTHSSETTKEIESKKDFRVSDIQPLSAFRACLIDSILEIIKIKAINSRNLLEIKCSKV